MPTFNYQARDAKGERVSGAHEAPDQRAALESLRARGLFVTKLEALKNGATPHEATGAPERSTPAAVEATTKSAPQNRAENAPSSPSQLSPSSQNTPAAPRVPMANSATAPLPPRFGLRANNKELSLFFRQMNSMLHAGVSLAHALNTMATNAPSKGLRTASAEMSTRTASGQQLSELMKSYPGIFTPLMTGMIRAGEAGGFLDRMCLRLSQYAERDYEIQQNIKRETWYPKLLLFVSLFIPSLIPTAIAIFNGKDWFGIWVQAFKGPAMLMLTGILIFKFKNYLAPLFKHFAPMAYAVDKIKLSIPVAGKTARALATAKFCRSLGTLQAAGMGVQQTIQLSADACGNAVIAQTSRKTIPLIEAGSSLTDALASTGQFPGVAIQMMRTGEATGNFDEQLDKVADFLETDAETTIKQSVVLLGIVIFLFIAIYIGIQVVQQYVGTYNSMIDQGIDLQN